VVFEKVHVFPYIRIVGNQDFILKLVKTLHVGGKTKDEKPETVILSCYYYFEQVIPQESRFFQIELAFFKSNG